MNKKRMFGFLLICFVCAGLCGCGLAKEEGKQIEKDSLIGGFVTRYALEERVDASVTWAFSKEPIDLCFEGLKGMIFYSFESNHDGRNILRGAGNTGFQNVQVKNEEAGNFIEITSVIYYVSKGADEIDTFYLNPVYRSENNQIYAMPGHCISAGGGMHSDGTVLTLNFNEEEKRTVLRETEITRVDVKAELHAIYEPLQVSICQMGEDHKVIKEETYVPKENSDDFIWVDQDTSYIHMITEEKLPNGETVEIREAFYWEGDRMELYEDEGQGDVLKEQKVTDYFTYYPVEDGFFRKDNGLFIWAE